MSPEIAVPAEHLFALVALVRLVVRVREQVGLEVGALVKAAATYRTLVWALLHVEDLVNSQCPRLAKTFAALLAFERFLF